MDDSRSSDLLSESIDIFCCSPNEESTNLYKQMDAVTYSSMIFNTKSSFSTIQMKIGDATFPGHFADLLEDCSKCILQSLDLVVNLLNESNININQLIEYMNDAICILQLLSDFIKHVIEVISMSCSSMRQFPIVTGRIIMTVFTHCKDSESVYGSQLSCVEKQIKDLFRTCHELQLTYLLVLEKHYIFNLTEIEEQNILVEVLDLNLKIGEIVQSLDVKTMAEQWKAYTVICEKYSDKLLEKLIYNDCTNILCTMLINNIKIALEENQEKVILRSLKVSSFTLKILLKICITFKHATIKNYVNVLELLLYIKLNDEAYLNTISEKSSQFINMYKVNITTPVDNLIAELLNDERFLQNICDYNVEKIKRDDKLLGFINLIISVIRCILQKDGESLITLQKHRLVNVIYTFLSYGHICFNLDLKYKCENLSSSLYETCGLYEQLLTHTVALISTMIIDEYHIVEKRMLEAVMSTDCVRAMFSSNLWILLARISSRQLLFAQVVSLSKLYKKLENNRQFVDSPQSVHLCNTIGRLFDVLATEDKMKIYSMFNIHDDQNMGLWRCLKIANLPNEVQCAAEEFAMNQLQTHVQKLTSEDIVNVDLLIKSIHLASTCSPKSRDENIELSLIKAWTKACPKHFTFPLSKLDKGNLWYYKYIEALVVLTESMEYILHKSDNLVKVLHVVTNIICSGCREFKILLINILCKLANFEANGLNKLSDTILIQTFSELFTSKDSIVRNKLFNTLRSNETHNVNRILSNVLNKCESLKEPWNYFIRHGRLKNDNFVLKEQLQNGNQNMGLWRCLKIANLPNEVQCAAEEFAMNQLQTHVQKLTSEDIVNVDLLIKSIHLASTCSPKSRDENIELSLIKAWTKACPKHFTFPLSKLDKGNLWYYKYIEALVVLTESMEYILHKSDNLVKVLHVVTNIICSGCREFKILLINILCKLANFEANGLNKLSDTILIQTFSELFTSKDSIVRNKLFNTLRSNETHNVNRILSNVLNKCESLKEPWNYFIRHGRLKNDNFVLKEQLQSAMDISYCHKCIDDGEDVQDPSIVLQKCQSSNFNIDIDMLFEPESDEEPACKKTKVNVNEVDEIISQLESNTSLLRSIKENVFTMEDKNRIKTICNKLRNILD